MPRLAVSICTSDRAALLARVLHAIERIEFGELATDQVDLIVVDNRPDGQARSVCEQAAAKLPIAMHFVEEGRQGISFARNRAVAEAIARGADFVAFLDDDDVPSSDWLDRLVRRQRETEADLVFGFWRLPGELQLPAWLHGTRYFRPPRPEDRNRYGLPASAGTYNLLATSQALGELHAWGGGRRHYYLRRRG